MDTLLSLLSGGQNALLMLLAAIVGAVGLVMGGRISGARAERDKQAGRDKAALEDQLEMHREANDIDRKVTGASDEQARQEAAKWSRR